jgi:hypothetical protein
VPIWHEDVEIDLDFHVFEVHDFDILIGHPFEQVFLEIPMLGNLDVKLGRDTFSIAIS